MTSNANNREDNLKVRGIFFMRKIRASDGKVLETYTDENLVVNLGRNNLAALLGGAAGGKKITSISVGTNGAAALVTDTTITDNVDKAITAVTYPDTGKVAFAWSLETTEANGMTIREFGLLNENDVLFARKVRADIIKDNTFRLEGTWTLIF